LEVVTLKWSKKILKVLLTGLFFCSIIQLS
jgi:hypothetical protein